MNAQLRKSLEEWFNRKGDCPDPEITDFNEWVERLADRLAGWIKDDKLVTVENLVSALRVQADADPWAKFFAVRARMDGWKTDTCCNVEDGMVYASVWLSRTEKDKTDKRADEIAGEFRKLGYTADIWVDEEEDTDYTVNAVIDFAGFLNAEKEYNNKKGGR